MSQALNDLSHGLASLVATAGRDAIAINGRASGFLWQPGVAVTANSALPRARRFRITLPDATEAAGECAGRDAGLDLAALRIDSPRVPTLERRAADLRPGQIVVTVGRSSETGLRASMGILSSVSNPWRNRHGRMLERFLRLDVSLHPGSAGAAVVDDGGQLIGMAVNTFSRFSVVAVPVETIARSVDQILAKGGVSRGYLGVGLQPVRVAGIAGIESRAALILINVEPESPASAAGLLLGDVLLSIEGQAIEQPDDVIAFLEPSRVGQTVSAEILRGGERRAISITVGQQPEGEES